MGSFQGCKTLIGRPEAGMDFNCDGNNSHKATVSAKEWLATVFFDPIILSVLSPAHRLALPPHLLDFRLGIHVLY